MDGSPYSTSLIELVEFIGVVEYIIGAGCDYMTEKRFKIVDEQFISYYGGTGHKISNEECGFWLWHSEEESQKVCDKLNNILNENEQLKQQCKDFIEMLEDMCVAYLINDGLEEILND